MKRYALIVCAIMLFSMVACTDNNGKAKNGTTVPDGVNEQDDILDNNSDLTGIDKGINMNDNKDNGAAANNGTNKTLKGTAQGYGGEVTVTVEVNGDDIVSVKVVGDSESEDIGRSAIEQLPARIEEADSTDIDGISGATMTSNAIKEAVNKALKSNK